MKNQVLSMAVLMGLCSAPLASAQSLRPTWATPIPKFGATAVYVGTNNFGQAPGVSAKVYQLNSAGNGWIDLTPNGISDVTSVTDLEWYNGRLYASTQTRYGWISSFIGLDFDTPTPWERWRGEVWRYDGSGTWTRVGLLAYDTVEESGSQATFLQQFNGRLYAGLATYVGPPCDRDCRPDITGALFSCLSCNGSDWQQVPIEPGSGGNGYYCGTVSSVCGQSQLYIGDIYSDTFYRYSPGGSVQLIDTQSGSCIWDFAELRGTLYAASDVLSTGPVYGLSPDRCDGPTSADFVPYALTGRINWAVETFQNRLWVGGQGGELRRFDANTPPLWNIPAPLRTFPTANISEPSEGVITLANDNNQTLWIGTGSRNGTEYYPADGIAEVWRTNGTSYTRVGPADFFQAGVQCITVVRQPVLVEAEPAWQIIDTRR
jgi:hypothetical protein